MTWGGKRENAGRPVGTKKVAKMRANLRILPTTKQFLVEQSRLKRISQGELIDKIIYEHQNITPTNR